MRESLSAPAADARNAVITVQDEVAFRQFLIGRDGAIVARFGSRTKPEDKELIEAVEQALKVPN